MLKNHTLSAARALLWSFGSPPLVVSDADSRWPSDEWCSWRALELAGILDHPTRASELQTFIESEKDHRLGARFERLIEFGLKHLPGYDCVRRRLQVYAEGRTLGEFDFIVDDTAAGRFEHWEVACKFYLGVPRDGALRWVGPGKRDSLVRKLGHLTERQLLLADTDACRNQMQDLGPVSRVRALVKGRLFYPLDDAGAVDREFSFGQAGRSIAINPRAPAGFWCDFDQLVRIRPAALFRLDKPRWLDPEASSAEIELEELEAGVQKAPRCIDLLSAEGQKHRVFVVRPDWFDDLDSAP